MDTICMMVNARLTNLIQQEYKEGKRVYNTSEWTKKIYLNNVQFPSHVIYTPRILYEFMTIARIQPSHRLYYYFFVVREVLFGKFMVKRELESKNQYQKRLKLAVMDVYQEAEDDDDKSKKFFDITKEEYLFFIKYWRIYTKEASDALAQGGEIGGDLYIRANEAFLIRMCMLINKNHEDLDAHSDVAFMCGGARLAKLVDPPSATDTLEYKKKYNEGVEMYNTALKQSQECNATLAQAKLRQSLWTRVVFDPPKEKEEEKKMEDITEEEYELL